MLKILRLMLGLWLALPAVAAQADWHRATTTNFVVHADLPEAELRQQVLLLEGFDRLLRLRFGVTSAEPQYPLQIYLLDKASEVDKLAGPVRASGFYRTGRYGSWAVASLEERGPGSPRTQEDILLHEYTHHFFFRHVQVQRPAWYVEGFAQYFATARLSRQGEWTVGAVAGNRAQALLKGERMPIRTLLTARPGDLSPGETRAFYAWSWLLVHRLYADPQRLNALQSYLAALGKGAEPLAAAEAAFGNLDAFERALTAYLKSPLMAVTYSPIGDYSGPLEIVKLTEGEAALVRPALRRRSGQDLAASRAELQNLAASYPNQASIWHELALAHLDLAARTTGIEAKEQLTLAETATDRALAIDPKHGRANLLKGELRMRELVATKDMDPAKWRDMRSYVFAANQANPDDPAPLFTWYETYRRQGKPPTETARAGLARAFALEPEVPDLRARYALDLAAAGDFAKAEALIMVLAGDPHRARQASELMERLKRLRLQPVGADSD